MLRDLHVMLIQSEAGREMTDRLTAGAIAALEQEPQASYEHYFVSNALELALAMQYAIKGMEFAKARRAFTAYIPIACLIRPQVPNFDIVTTDVFRNLSDIATRYSLAMSNGVLVCETVEQAEAQSQMNAQNHGAIAVAQCIKLIDLKGKFSLLRR